MDREAPEAQEQERENGSRVALWVLGLVLVSQVVVQVGFGANAVVLKLFAQRADVHPMLFSFLRDLCATPVLMLVALVVEGKKEAAKEGRSVGKGLHLRVPASGKEAAVFCILGFLGMFVNQVFFIEGVYLTSASVAAAFQPAIPVFAAILAMAIGIEPLPSRHSWHGWAKLLGVAATVVGALLMLVTGSGAEEEGDGGEGWEATLGVVCLVINTLGMAGYVVLQKRFVFFREDVKAKEERECDSRVIMRWWDLRLTVREEEEHNVTSSMDSFVDRGGDVRQEDSLAETAWDEGETGIELQDMKEREAGQEEGESQSNCLEQDDAEREGNGPGAKRRALFSSWAALPFTVTSWSYLFASVFMCLISLTLVAFQPSVLDGFNEGLIFPLCYAVFISSTLCYGLITVGNKFLSSSVVTAFWPLQIAAAFGLSYVLLDERLSALQWTGAAAILLGLALVTVADNFQAQKA